MDRKPGDHGPVHGDSNLPRLQPRPGVGGLRSLPGRQAGVEATRFNSVSSLRVVQLCYRPYHAARLQSQRP